MIAGETEFKSSFDEPVEGDNMGEDGLGKASPREDLFGIIDLVFRGMEDGDAGMFEAAYMAEQFINHEIFEGSMPSFRTPSRYGRPAGEVMVRVVYRRVIHSPELLYNDSPRKQRESVQAAYERMRLEVPDGKAAWKIADNEHIIWFPYNKLTYDTVILLEKVDG